MTTFTTQDRIDVEKERMKDISEHVIKAKKLLSEIEELIAPASMIPKSKFFELSVELHAETSQLVIEADRLGNELG